MIDEVQLGDNAEPKVGDKANEGSQTAVNSAVSEVDQSVLHFEDLEEGATWTSPIRAITESDVRIFAELTGDYDPLHQLDELSNEAKSDPQSSFSPFGRPVVHGLLGLSVMAGLGTGHPRVATLALVGIEDWEFNAPLYFEDHVFARTTIERASRHGRRAGRIVWWRQLISEEGRVIQQGRLITLVAARHRPPRLPR